MKENKLPILYYPFTCIFFEERQNVNLLEKLFLFIMKKTNKDEIGNTQKKKMSCLFYFRINKLIIILNHHQKLWKTV